MTTEEADRAIQLSSELEIMLLFCKISLDGTQFNGLISLLSKRDTAHTAAIYDKVAVEGEIVWPEKPNFEYAGTNPNAGIYRTDEDAVKHGYCQGVTACQLAVHEAFERGRVGK